MIGHRSSVIKVVLFAVSGLGFLWSACAEQQVSDYKHLKYPKLRDIEVPRVEQVTLANGMRLFLLEDHELPLVSVSVRIRTGSVYEPAEKIGLASITGEVMRTGGTTSKTGD
ncbi:MAG: M16 family metallopeptidase, partial [Planctomycetota bacterium]